MSQTVYGVHAVTALLQGDPVRIRQVLLQPGREEKLQALIQQLRARGIAIEQRSRRELDQLAPGVHQGVVALVEPSAEAGEAELFALLDGLQRPALLLVLDGITDPHNLGACLRTANAAGADGIVLPKDRSAPLNSVARKAASGAAELTPCFRVTNLARTLGALKEQGLWLVAATADGHSTLFQADLKGPVALVMGAEGHGLRRLTRAQCDFEVAIPMQGAVGSLNVSVASALLLYEAVRQRGGG